MSEEREISIKVNICDRFYPLKIAVNEEEKVRLSAKNINERVKFFENNYSIQDKQDALAMVCLEFATEPSQNGSTTESHISSLMEKLDELENLLEI
jgi:cell division protein ZapA